MSLDVYTMQVFQLIFKSNTLMKTIKFFLLTLSLCALTSCSEEEDSPQLLSVESEQFRNLFAPQSGGQGQGPISGDFTKFDFASGSTTTSETDWDIAFRGTTIIVNGGESQDTTDEPVRTGNAAAYIAENTFAEVVQVNTDLFVQDSPQTLAIPTGSGNGWYDYTPFPVNLVTPTAGRILVLRTRDNRLVKLEILSYYKDAPANPDANVDEARYYTFNYVYQPNEGLLNF